MAREAASAAVLARNGPQCGTDNAAAAALVEDFAWERNYDDRNVRTRKEVAPMYFVAVRNAGSAMPPASRKLR